MIPQATAAKLVVLCAYSYLSGLIKKTD